MGPPYSNTHSFGVGGAVVPFIPSCHSHPDNMLAGGLQLHPAPAGIDLLHKVALLDQATDVASPAVMHCWHLPPKMGRRADNFSAADDGSARVCQQTGRPLPKP